MTLPGLRDRCIRIGSAGKSFSLTGWKVGYATAAPALADVIARAHGNLAFATAPNLQRAVAYGLDKAAGYFEDLAASLRARHRLLGDGLAAIGLDVLPAAAGYFTIADVGRFAPDGDAAFCRRITERAGVAAIPVSAFYAGPDAPDRYVRFAHCKREAVLVEALERLRRYLDSAG